MADATARPGPAIGTLIAWAIAGAGIAAALAMALAPPFLGLAPALQTTLGVIVGAIGLWATGVVPPHYTSLLFMFFAVTLPLAPPATVFSGFHSGAVWLVFGGLILGVGVDKSGLGARLVRFMLRHVSPTYAGVVWATAIGGALLSYVIPSAVGRVMLYLPIVLAFAEQLGFRPGSNGRTGMALTAGCATMIPAFAILPANVPNMGLIGAAESIYGVHFTYGEYFLLNYAFLGLAVVLLIPILVLRLFPDRPVRAELPAAPPGWTGSERKLLVILVAALGLWVTDFIHGVHPAWVAFGAGLLCLVPRAGLLPQSVLTKDINYGPWIFVSGVIGMGAVVNQTGLGRALAEGLFAIVPLTEGAGAGNFALISLVNMVTGLITTLPAAPGVLTPLAQSISDASGWPLVSVLYTQVPAWIVFPFPYQAPPIVVTMALAGISVAKALRLLIPLFVIGVVILMPLQYLWGNLIGIYP